MLALFVGLPNEKGFGAVPAVAGVELPKLKAVLVAPALAVFAAPKVRPGVLPVFCAGLCPNGPELLAFVVPWPKRDPLLLFVVFPKVLDKPVLLAEPKPVAEFAPNENGLAPLGLLLPKPLTAGVELKRLLPLV